jgi:hypothetical protein
LCKEKRAASLKYNSAGHSIKQFPTCRILERAYKKSIQEGIRQKQDRKTEKTGTASGRDGDISGMKL